MGTSIHTFMEYKNTNNNWIEFKFNNRKKYGIWNNDYYPWLKFIGNISRVDSIEFDDIVYYIEPFKLIDYPYSYGLPLDISPTVFEKYEKHIHDYHSCAYYTLEELQNFNYNKILSIKYIKNVANAVLKKVKNPDESTSYREFLGNDYFTFIQNLEKFKKKKKCNEIRVIIWFDN